MTLTHLKRCGKSGGKRRRKKKRETKERRTRRLMERTEITETAGMPDQMGMREREACFAPVQRWGRTKRVVHQIFI